MGISFGNRGRGWSISSAMARIASDRYIDKLNHDGSKSDIQRATHLFSDVAGYQDLHEPLREQVIAMALYIALGDSFALREFTC